MLTVTLALLIFVAVASASRQPHDRRTGGMAAPRYQHGPSEEPTRTGQRQTRPKLTGPVTDAIQSDLGRMAAQVGTGSVSTYRGKTAAHWAWRFKKRTRQLQIARRALKQSLSRPVYGLSSDERAFMCIHGFEGSWTDPDAPFYGGLQMDRSFMATYGGWALKAFGTADKWPISVQLAVAIRAKVSGRGFYPWPNTARYCGLIP